jgi:hypothetical protein
MAVRLQRWLGQADPKGAVAAPFGLIVRCFDSRLVMPAHSALKTRVNALTSRASTS